MAAVRLLPNGGAINDNEAAERLLPNGGAIKQTEAASGTADVSFPPYRPNPMRVLLTR